MFVVLGMKQKKREDCAEKGNTSAFSTARTVHPTIRIHNHKNHTKTGQIEHCLTAVRMKETGVALIPS
jgi:hypothetical protein